MGAFVDSLPPAARASTTGQGIAAAVATAAGLIASHFTNNPEYIGIAGTLAAAVTLIVFPQATGATSQQAMVATEIKTVGTDVETLIAAVRLGHSAAAPSPAAPTIAILPAPPVIEEKAHA